MTATAPEETRWWPSPFGADDQLGMLNHVDEAKRLRALSLVREGRSTTWGGSSTRGFRCSQAAISARHS